jgi:hypothetical protein
MEEPAKRKRETLFGNSNDKTCDNGQDPIDLEDINDIDPEYIISLEYPNSSDPYGRRGVYQCYNIISLVQWLNSKNTDPLTNKPFTRDQIETIKQRIKIVISKIFFKMNDIWKRIRGSKSKFGHLIEPLEKQLREYNKLLSSYSFSMLPLYGRTPQYDDLINAVHNHTDLENLLAEKRRKLIALDETNNKEIQKYISDEINKIKSQLKKILPDNDNLQNDYDILLEDYNLLKKSKINNRELDQRSNPFRNVSNVSQKPQEFSRFDEINREDTDFNQSRRNNIEDEELENSEEEFGDFDL